MIQGWRQGLAEMKVGSTWVLEIAPNLAYGDGGFGSAIPGNATLIFHVTLISK